jgi:hypothetical protein
MGSSYLFQPYTWWLLMESSQLTREMKWMNCSEAFWAGSAKNCLETGLKPLSQFGFWIDLLLFAKLVFVVQKLEFVTDFVHDDQSVFSG